MRHQEGCYTYSTGVTQFRTANSCPHWGSLHEVLEIQTNKAKTQCCVCCITSSIHIIFRTYDHCEWVGVRLVKGIAKFASLGQVDNCTWIHSKNTMLVRMPPRWGVARWWGNLLSFWSETNTWHLKEKLAASIEQLGWFCYIWVKCICIGIKVLIWSAGGV